MQAGFMNLRARQALHDRAVATSAEPFRRAGFHPDAPLLASLNEFNILERRKINLLRKRATDDGVAAMSELGRLSVDQWKHLIDMCLVRATTVRGQRARAMAFALWDGGDLAHRAEVSETAETAVLLAVVRDLTW